MVNCGRVRKIIWAGVSTSILLVSVAFSSEASKVGQISVNIEPQEGMAASFVKKKLKTSTDQPLDSDVLQQDRERLKKSARVRDVEIKTKELEKGKKHLVFHITQAPELKAIHIEGAQRIAEKELRSALQASPGSSWTRGKREADKKQLRKVYNDVEHLEDVKIEAVVKIDKQHQADVTWKIRERPVPNVKQIRFEGNIVFGKKALLQQIETRPSSFWRFFSDRDVFRRDVFEEDKERLKDFYRSKGYLAFEIKSADVAFRENGNKVNIKFAINEGPLFSIGKIEVQGNEEVSDRAMLSQLQSTSGLVFDPELVNADIETIKHVYAIEGIEDVSCDEELKKHSSKQRVDIIYQVQTGQSK